MQQTVWSAKHFLRLDVVVGFPLNLMKLILSKLNFLKLKLKLDKIRMVWLLVGWMDRFWLVGWVDWRMDLSSV